jgi:hypothetical protein
MMPSVMSRAMARPANGEMMMNTPIVRSPDGTTTSHEPAAATAAPAIPPTSACEELLGSPK